MAKAAPEGLITALDIGSSKVSAMIAQKGDGGELIVLGTGQRESRGVKRGYIADAAATEVAVREAVEQAERIAGTNIENVWVSFSAGGLVSDVASIEFELGGHRVEQSDIDALLQAGRDSIDPAGRMVLHAQPALYTLDGLTGVKRPLGLHADRLGVHIHVVAADGSPVRNLGLCVANAHLEVRAIIASPVATGMACLSDEERELGVALVELGAGITNVSLFAGGMLVGLTSIPFGAADITDDIASAFGTRRAQAERMKCFYGSANASPRDNHDMIDVAPISAEDDASESSRMSSPPVIETITPLAPFMLTPSSSGLAIALDAASMARLSPEASPVPIIALPISCITERTSAKSRLMRPGMTIRSVMPRTPCCSTSSAIWNASLKVVFALATRKRFWLGMTISVSTYF